MQIVLSTVFKISFIIAHFYIKSLAMMWISLNTTWRDRAFAYSINLKNSNRLTQI